METWLTGSFEGAPLLVSLALAAVLGPRPASDPAPLVAVTSLVAAERGDTRKAARLGACWGAGHAGVLLLVGLPLIFLKSSLPSWFEHGAERAVGLVILVLALRVMLKWLRGDYRLAPHDHRGDTDVPHPRARR